MKWKSYCHDTMGTCCELEGFSTNWEVHTLVLVIPLVTTVNDPGSPRQVITTCRVWSWKMHQRSGSHHQGTVKILHTDCGGKYMLYAFTDHLQDRGQSMNWQSMIPPPRMVLQSTLTERWWHGHAPAWSQLTSLTSYGQKLSSMWSGPKTILPSS